MAYFLFVDKFADLRGRYSIGRVSELFNLTVQTLRYYEETGVIGDIGRDSGGRRAYSQENIYWLDFVCQVKNTGMPLKEIRKYRELLLQGDSTSAERRDLMIEHKSRLEYEERKIADALELINYKIEHYDEVLSNHTP